MKGRFLYVRGLRKVDHTVFAVSDGQKTYYDPISNKRAPYSSGQQVKRSIIDTMLVELGKVRSEVVFNYQLKGKSEVGEKEALTSGDPRFPDQLIAGWMNAEQNSAVLKRRSPLSISAMHPLHPHLAALNSESLTYDRSDSPTSKVELKDAKGKVLSKEEMLQYLEDNNRNLPAKKFIQDQNRTSGLFVYDIAIDLHRLFNIELDDKEPSMPKDMVEELTSEGWIKTSNENGSFLTCPKELQNEIIPALASAILQWKITSNQSRTFSLMECVAISISTNASKIGYSIRAKLTDERRAKLIIEDIGGVDTFITPAVESILHDVDGDVNALDLAHSNIVKHLSS